VVYGDTIFIGPDGDQLPTPAVRRYSGRITRQLLLDNFVPFSTALVRRSLIDELKGFDEGLSMSIDYHLWLRASLLCEFQYVPEALLEYRIWPGQMSYRMEERRAPRARAGVDGVSERRRTTPTECSDERSSRTTRVPPVGQQSSVPSASDVLPSESRTAPPELP
jgi:hypothetical protein